MFAKVFEAESRRVLQTSLENWLKENDGIKIENVSQSAVAFNDSDGNYYIVTLVVFYSV